MSASAFLRESDDQRAEQARLQSARRQFQPTGTAHLAGAVRQRTAPAEIGGAVTFGDRPGRHVASWKLERKAAIEPDQAVLDLVEAHRGHQRLALIESRRWIDDDGADQIAL